MANAAGNVGEVTSAWREREPHPLLGAIIHLVPA